MAEVILAHPEYWTGGTFPIGHVRKDFLAIMDIVCIDPNHKCAAPMLSNPTCVPPENAESLSDQHPGYAQYHRDSTKSTGSSTGTLVSARDTASRLFRGPSGNATDINRGIAGIQQWRAKPSTPKPPPPPKRPASSSSQDGRRIVMRSGPQSSHTVFNVHSN